MGRRRTAPIPQREPGSSLWTRPIIGSGRKLQLLFPSLLLFGAAGVPSEAPGQAAAGIAAGGRPWQPIIRGRLASIEAEPAVYAESDSGPALVRIRVGNLSLRPLAVAADYWSVVFPNQWGFHRHPYRTTVDEPEFQLPPLGRDDTLRLLVAQRERAMPLVPPGNSVEYFREFAGGRPGPAGSAASYLIISLSGRLLVSDGLTAEELTLIGALPKTRDLVIPLPLTWRQVPQHARIIRHP